jgi:hypothetical protein
MRGFQPRNVPSVQIADSTMSSHVDAPDWSTIPVPSDDGAAGHLPGLKVPSIPLPATDGTTVDLSALAGLVVVYA